MEKLTVFWGWPKYVVTKKLRIYKFKKFLAHNDLAVYTKCFAFISDTIVRNRHDIIDYYDFAYFGQVHRPDWTYEVIGGDKDAVSIRVAASGENKKEFSAVESQS